jgi:hypothetical protein
LVVDRALAQCAVATHGLVPSPGFSDVCRAPPIGVIKFQHLPENQLSPYSEHTCAPRNSHGSGKLAVIKRAAKPGIAMNIIPLDVQRRYERRWAARFGRPDSKGVGIAEPDQPISMLADEAFSVAPRSDPETKSRLR